MAHKTPQEIVKALIDAGFTQMQIQEHTGVRQSILSRLLSGKHKDPRMSTIRALEDFHAKQVDNEKA